MNDSHPICCNRNKVMLIEKTIILPYFSHCCKIPVSECVKCAVAVPPPPSSGSSSASTTWPELRRRCRHHCSWGRTWVSPGHRCEMGPGVGREECSVNIWPALYQYHFSVLAPIKQHCLFLRLKSHPIALHLTRSQRVKSSALHRE